MVGTKNQREDYDGVNPTYEEQEFCFRCDECIETGMKYYERWNGEPICASCMASIKTINDLIYVLGYEDLSDLLTDKEILQIK